MIRETLCTLRYANRDLRKAIKRLPRRMAEWRRFWRSFREYQSSNPSAWTIQTKFLLPCLGDDTAQTQIEPIYFYQDSWAFEHIVRERPARHVDVGSHHKYVALLSKVVPVTMVDLRPLSLPLAGLKFQQGSILELPFPDRSVPSVSSLCVVEHIGLGRYGDPIDPRGTEKAIAELKRVIQPEGNLYLSLPLDDENRIYFNAHRAFKESYLMELFGPFRIVDRAYIYGDQFGRQLQSGFGVGCYWLRAPA